jgi:hypothetical protein
MLTALSTLTSLETFWLGFESPRSRPNWASRHPPPRTRSVLPALVHFEFKGFSEYLEDLMARIDAPRLSRLNTMFLNETVFVTPKLVHFICCTSTLKAFEKASVVFDDGVAAIRLWHLSNLEQVCADCAPSLPPPFMPEDHHDYEYEAKYWQPDREDNIEDILWLELLLPFTAVRDLYLSEAFAERVVPTLQELVGRMTTTEVLPTLQNIFLEGFPPSGPVQEGIRQFVASRQVTNHHIAVSRWDRLGDRTKFQEVDC